MSPKGSTASPHLPAAVVLLALSITTLAAVLVSIERSRARRSTTSRARSSNERFPSAVSAPGSMPLDVGCDDALVRRSMRQSSARTRPLPHDVETRTCGAVPRPRRRRRQCRCISRVGPAQPTPIFPSEATRTNDFCGCPWDSNQAFCRHCCGAIGGSNNGRENVEDRAVPHGNLGNGYRSRTLALEVRSTPLAGTTPSHPDVVMIPSPTLSEVRVETRRSGTTSTPTLALPVPKANENVISSASGGRRRELLVHNVSHKDMVLSLRRTRSPAVTTTAAWAVGEGSRERFNAINAPDTALARPKFSLFKPSSELILQKMLEIKESGGGEPPSAVCAVYRRGEELEQEPGPEIPLDRSEDNGTIHEDPRDPATAANSNDERRQQQYRRHLSVGFDLNDNPIPISDLAGYRVRSADLDRLAPGAEPHASDMHMAMNRRDSAGGDLALAWRHHCAKSGDGDVDWRGGGRHSEHWSSTTAGPRLGEGWRDGEGGEAFITGVYFPLLSVLMPRWLEQLAGNGDCDAEKTILLVSGVGRPRNQEHRVEDNSTEVTAELMEAYLRRHYPDVRVVRVHSNTNIFRYDDNIRFVKTELLPLLEAERSQTAEKYGPDWQDMMHITMSFADGSPARISSINTALRPFRPSFIHIWELKTFWHERIICEDDVEVHTFDDIDMLPPIPRSEVDPSTALVIDEMLRLREDLERVLAAPPSHRPAVVGSDAMDDLASFWLRKTKKPVLAVLLVQKKGCEPKLYRGTNMEVSMPTGSLCAERNVIGSALSADLTLLRGDIKAVAVLSMPRLGRTLSIKAVSNENSKDNDRLNAAAMIIARADRGEGESKSWGGFASAATSVPGSSLPSRAGSPFTLTPALKMSPARPRHSDREEGANGGVAGGSSVDSSGAGRSGNISAWDSRDEREGEKEDTRGVAVEDTERLEGVRKALFGVVPGNHAAAADRAPDMAAATAAKTTEAEASPHPAEAPKSMQEEQQRQTYPEKEQSGAICAPPATKPRIRSQSCADKLLAAGRTVSERGLGCCGNGEAARSGENHHVPRSQSFDGGVAGAALDQPSPSLIADISRRKSLRATKVVRSIHSLNPKRESGSGRIGRLGAGPGGAWSDVNDGDGVGGRWEETRSRQNRSSIVAHVPAETLCSNPLKPCGACMEWLKKIAEVNPDFKVITFTDSCCGGVYIEDVAQIL